ncbi:uncharacterized protein LOC143283684 isoform X2 [Babylonia areolata]|uniref:uncharacterized protein LOC143283684 isoform X2 n=1 Tax=Babylonia areolata TaxID=304850 RepID=UPI003FD12D4F
MLLDFSEEVSIDQESVLSTQIKMASQPESKIPGPGGGSSAGGRDKRRSFLPAPKRPSAIPSPSASAPSVLPEPPVPTLKLQSRSSPPEQSVAHKEVTIPGTEKLTVGKRILIGGVKPGILRFVGKTGLAPGVWCGIELFDSSGLHDGEVDGKRYFTCKPFRGIFAPLDKVVPDESYKSPVREEKISPVSEDIQEANRDEELVAESVEKPVEKAVDSKVAADSEPSKIPAPRSQIARLSGIPRIGPSSLEKGVSKSKSADGIKESTSKIAVFSKRSSSGQDASKVDLNSTFVRDDKETAKPRRRRSEDGDADFSLNQTYSCDLEKHLKSDSRHYFNITFNKDIPPLSNTTSSNLPDVVSSASPSPPRETASRFIPGTLNQTQSAQDIATSLASDMSLGVVDPDIIADDTNLLEGVIPDQVAAATSESDISLSGNSSTLEETSVATVNEVAAAAATASPDLNSTPLHGVDFKKFLHDSGGENLPSDGLSDAESVGSSSTTASASGKSNLAQQVLAVVSRKEELKEEQRQRKDSSGSISSISAAVRADLLQEEGSNGVSPEVSQVLEWDYDHDAFDGKLLLEKCQDGMSTSTSDSCSEASADQGGGALALDKNTHDVDIPPPDGEEANLFEAESEDGFENIDNIEDFPLGMSKDTQHMMTDSGISEKGFLDPGGAESAASKRKSVEFDNKVNVAVGLPPSDGVVPDSEGGKVVDVAEGGGGSGGGGGEEVAGVVERRMAVDANLQKDLMDGHTRQERPLSLVSTTSADTGYVPDTDSETGTLTTNSPTEWTEKQLNANLAAAAGGGGGGGEPRLRAAAHGSSSSSAAAEGLKPKPAVVMAKGLTDEVVKDSEVDSDICSDAAADTAAAVAAETGSDKTLEAVGTQGGKAPCSEETEESEGEEDEHSEESSEDDTASEDEEEGDDDDEVEEEEAEAVDDDRPEDDRVEADRVGPSGDIHPATQLSAEGSNNRPVPEAALISMTESTGTDIISATSTTATEAPETTQLESAGPSAQEERPQTTISAAPSPDTSRGPEQLSCSPATSASTDTAGVNVAAPRPEPKKKLSPLASSADKKVMAEHKKLVKSAHSRLSDYIKSPAPPPPPSKLKEEPNKAETKKKSNVGDAKTNKTTAAAGKKQDNGSGSLDKTKANPGGSSKAEKIAEKKAAPVVVKEDNKPKVKRAAPKSKWGNIMSQIEAGKDTANKPKPKTDVKSSLAVYRTAAPSPSPTAKRDAAERDGVHHARPKDDSSPTKPKSKLKLAKHSKPDFSNVKSKLNLSSPPLKLSGGSPRGETPTTPSSRGSTPRDSVSPRDHGIPIKDSDLNDMGNINNSNNPRESGNPKDAHHGSAKDSLNTKRFANAAKDSNPKHPANPTTKDSVNPRVSSSSPFPSMAGNPKEGRGSSPAGNPKEGRGSSSRMALPARKTLPSSSVSRLKAGGGGRVGPGSGLTENHQETLDNCSVMSQATSSRTDLSVLDYEGDGGTSPRAGQSSSYPVVASAVVQQQKKRNALSCAGAPRQKNERSSSAAGSKSDVSSAQSVKARNLRNAQKHDVITTTNVSASKKFTVKSSIPPPTPRPGSKLTKPPATTTGSAAEARSKSSPPKLTPSPPSKARSSTNTPAHRGSNQSLSRNRAGSGLKSGQPPDVVSTSARGSRAQEVARLESLCEARTKELNYTRMQLKAGLQAFDAMACLLNYCTTQLNAFSCPAITAKLKTSEGKLTEQHELIERLNQQKAELEQQVQEVRGAKESALQEVCGLRQEMGRAEEAHAAEQQRLREEHQAALKELEENLTSQHQKNVQQMETCQEKHAEYLKQAHKRQVTEITNEHQMFTNQVKLAHLEEIQELRNKHDQQMEELHSQHRNKLEDITRRFESIKLSLSEKVQSLCEECDELRMRAKTSEEALQRDADVKVQLALAPYLHLPNEIESLKMVIDMRTEEIQKLRRHNMDLEKQLEELPIAQEKVASLQQKVENLQAIINIKTDHEKQLHEKCQVLMRKYDKESRANKRLSMDYEQVMWRMSQSADLTGSMESLGRQLSSSPCRMDDLSRSSPSPVRRSLSNMSHGEGGAVHTPAGVARRHHKAPGGGEEDFDRKIRCRSATFSLDKSKSPRSSKTSAASSAGVNGSSSSPGSPSKHPLSASCDYTDMIVAAMNSHSESFSSEQGSGDTGDVQPSMRSSVILKTSQGVSYNIDVVENGEKEAEEEDRQDDVFVMEDLDSPPHTNIPKDLHLPSTEVEPQSEVTVVVDSPTSD